MIDKNGKEIPLDASLNRFGLEMKEELSKKALEYVDKVQLMNTNITKSIKLTRVVFFLEVEGEPLWVSRIVEEKT